MAASRNPKGSVWRLPLFSALVVLAAGVLVWRSLLPLEAERRELQTQKTGVALVSAVGGKLRAQIDASLRQTERLGRLDTSRDAFERDAQLFLRDFAGVLAIRYSRGEEQFQVARPDVDASNVLAGFDAVATESTQARIDGYTQALSRPTHVGERTLYFLRFTHIADAQTLTMTTALDVQSWLGEPLAQETGYRAAVLDGDDPVIDAAHIARSDANAQVFPLVGAGRPWTLVVAPGPVLLAATESHLPESVLGGTFLLALAIGLATYLALLARERKDRVADHEERRRSAEAARDIAHSDLGSVLESITDGFIIFDSEFRYTSINDVGARLAGLPAAEMIGRSVWELFPGFAATPEAELMRSAMAERKSISFERLRADGRYYSMRTYPHRDGMALYFHDISAQRQIADRLRKSETLLNLAQSIASIGSFTYDVNTHEEHWSDQMLPLLGLTHEQRDGRRFLNFVEPGDCVRLVEAEAQLGVEFPEKEVRLHVVRPNGERRAVVTRMRLERDGDGLGAFIVGTVQDITNFESAEQARTAALSQSRQQSAKFRALNRAMLLINAKLGHPDLHQVLVEELRETVRAHIGVLQFDAPGMQPVTSFSEKYTNWLHASSTVASLHRLAESGRTGKPMRLSQADLAGNPIWSALNALPSDHRELHGLLSVPLYDRRGERLGFLQASDRLEGEFSADDEAIAVQFAQIASVAIGWARLIDDLRKTQVDLSEQLEEIRRSRALLAEAQRVARLGSWEIEPPLALPLRITLSEEAARIVESDAVIAFDALAERVHDDDAEMLRQRIGDLVSGHITSLDAEVRYRAAHAFKRLHIKAQVAIDRGNLAHVVGSLQDVTQQRLDAEQDRLNAVAFAGIAAGIPLDDSLAVIIGMYESRFPDGICSILLYDPQKGLRTGAAPGLSAEYSRRIRAVSQDLPRAVAARRSGVANA